MTKAQRDLSCCLPERASQWEARERAEAGKEKQAQGGKRDTKRSGVGISRTQDEDSRLVRKNNFEGVSSASRNLSKTLPGLACLTIREIGGPRANDSSQAWPKTTGINTAVPTPTIPREFQPAGPAPACRHSLITYCCICKKTTTTSTRTILGQTVHDRRPSYHPLNNIPEICRPTTPVDTTACDTDPHAVHQRACDGQDTGKRKQHRRGGNDAVICTPPCLPSKLLPRISLVQYHGALFFGENISIIRPQQQMRT